jgi:hypothetical protein
VKCEKIEDRAAGIIYIFNGSNSHPAARELHNLAIKQFACPGEASWPLGTLFPGPQDRTEGGQLHSF